MIFASKHFRGRPLKTIQVYAEVCIIRQHEMLMGCKLHILYLDRLKFKNIATCENANFNTLKKKKLDGYAYVIAHTTSMFNHRRTWIQ